VGERGIAPKPQVLKELEGTSHHPLNKNMPRPPSLAPDPPKWLSPRALAEWEEIVLEMGTVPGWLTRVNKSTLAGHCHWYAMWSEAVEFLNENGNTYETIIGQDIESGETAIVKKIRPEVKLAKEAWTAMIKCDMELGITPSRGSAVQLPSGDPDDEAGLDQQGRGYPRPHAVGTEA
jgi:P27 family predicted phage terminase small subunit